MATPTFPVPYGPIFPVEADYEPRLNVTTYGDGYEQATGDGINILKPQTEVVWEGLTESEANQGLDFLKELAGQRPFMWRYPGDAEETKWVCRKWRRRLIGANNYGISATFLRSFNPS